MHFQEVKEILGLNNLDQEGGWFNEIYRCKVPSSQQDRCCGTSIYYALAGKQISKFHKVTSDEIWLYHAGTPARQILLYEDGHWEEHIIGPDLKAGQRPQSIIPAGTWQGASLIDQSDESWGLFGATVFPGFEYNDFSVCPASELMNKFPDAKDAIINAKLNID